MKVSIRIRLLLFQFFTLFVVITSIYLFTYFISKGYLENSLYKNHAEIAQPYAEIINQYLDSRITEIRVISQASDFEMNNFRGISKYFEESLNESRYISNLALMDTSGHLIEGKSEDQWISQYSGPEHLSLFKMAINGNQGDVFIRPVYKNPVTGTINLDLYAPVTDDANIEILGVLISTINMAPIENWINKIGKGFESKTDNFLLTADNKIIFSNDETQSQFSGYPVKFEQEKYWISETAILNHGLNRECNWRVVSNLDKSTSLLLPKKLQQQFLWTSIVFIIFGFVIAYFSSSLILNPIKGLLSGIIKVENGNYDTEVKLDKKDELGELIKAFNRLVKRLKSNRSKLIESEERFRKIIEFSPYGFLLYKLGVCHYVNESTLQLFKYNSPSDLVGGDFKKVVREDEWDRVVQRIADVQASKGKLPVFKFVGVRSDGTNIHLESTSFRVDINNENYTIAVLRDVDEEYRLNKKLVASEELYRTVSKISIDAIWDYDLNSGKIKWNDSIYDVFGYPKLSTAYDGKWWISKVHPDDLEKVQRFTETIEKGEKSWSSNYRFLTNNGQWKHVESSAIIMYNDQKKAFRAIGTMRDVTFKVEADNERIRSLILGGDRERQRLSAELHDSLGQILSLISLNIDSIMRSNDMNSKQNIEKLNLSYSMINQAVEEVRNISHNLMPRALEDFGLKSVISDMINRIELISGIETELKISEGFDRFDPNIEINVFRIIQEILTNAVRHAKTKNILLQISVKGQKIVILYQDSGQGFNISEVKYRKGSSGLKNIENRVRILEGRLTLRSLLNKGTSISVEIPF
jgi:PAS domain S-box-containing protein